jgi:hypothetical protein
MSSAVSRSTSRVVELDEGIGGGVIGETRIGEIGE